jgi:catechol 2,3-dioxygenase-like lactoylglutathione lyase family enzyme
MQKIISGIQQLGVGIPDVMEAWKWFRLTFGMDIRVFEDDGIAGLMLPYTGNSPQQRHAVLAINMQGGGGMEIWQYKGRTPQPPAFNLELGDLGIIAGKIKSRDVKMAFKTFKSKGLNVLSEVELDPQGKEHFYLKDPYNNIYQVIGSRGWFGKSKAPTGGVYGAIIGVSDMDKSIKFYQKILEYETIVYDKTGIFDEFNQLPGGKNRFRRVLLRHNKPRKGAFSKMLGSTKIELLQVLDRQPKKIFQDRFWGDLGFIHLCFDVKGMDILKQECKNNNTPFTIDTNTSFDMGEAAGRFAYTEDPDGTLIEFVETNKVPVIKKWGLYLNLSKRNPEKTLPDWMIRTLSFNRVKD